MAVTSSSRRPTRPAPGRVPALGTAAQRPGARTVRTPLGAALPAAAWSALLGIAVVTLLVVLGWVAAPDNGLTAGQVGAAGAQGWLLANFADLQVADGALPAGTLGLTPLGLVLLPGYILYRSGAWAARSADVRDFADAARTACLLAVLYGTLATACGVLATSSTVTPGLPSVVVGATTLALVAAGAGVLRGSGLWVRLPQVLPAEVVVAARATVCATAAVVAGGAVLLAASLVAHGGRVNGLWSTLQPDPAGGVLLLLLCVALVPNALLWAAAYSLGPGFAVGVGTSVAPAGIVVGAVPAVPVLGALPGAGDAPPASLVGLALPVVAGVLAGIVVSRDRRLRALAPARLARVGGLAGVAAGLLVGTLTGLSSGGLGGGRMGQLGPSGLEVALVAGVELGAVAALTAWEWRRHAERRTIRL